MSEKEDRKKDKKEVNVEVPGKRPARTIDDALPPPRRRRTGAGTGASPNVTPRATNATKLIEQGWIPAGSEVQHKALSGLPLEELRDMLRENLLPVGGEKVALLVRLIREAAGWDLTDADMVLASDEQAAAAAGNVAGATEDKQLDSLSASDQFGRALDHGVAAQSVETDESLPCFVDNSMPKKAIPKVPLKAKQRTRPKARPTSRKMGVLRRTVTPEAIEARTRKIGKTTPQMPTKHEASKPAKLIPTVAELVQSGDIPAEAESQFSALVLMDNTELRGMLRELKLPLKGRKHNWVVRLVRKLRGLEPVASDQALFLQNPATGVSALIKSGDIPAEEEKRYNTLIQLPLRKVQSMLRQSNLPDEGQKVALVVRLVRKMCGMDPLPVDAVLIEALEAKQKAKALQQEREKQERHRMEQEDRETERKVNPRSVRRADNWEKADGPERARRERQYMAKEDRPKKLKGREFTLKTWIEDAVNRMDLSTTTVKDLFNIVEERYSLLQPKVMLRAKTFAIEAVVTKTSPVKS